MIAGLSSAESWGRRAFWPAGIGSLVSSAEPAATWTEVEEGLPSGRVPQLVSAICSKTMKNINAECFFM